MSVAKLDTFNDLATTYSGQRAVLATELNRAGLAGYTQAILDAARPAAVLVPVPMPDRDIPVGCSKVGGAPDLPAGVDWPTADVAKVASWNDFEPSGNIYDIPFLLQINLADLDGIELDIPLPRRGLLSVFHGADQYGETGFRLEGVRPGWRVLYTPEDVPLSRRIVTAARRDEWPPAQHDIPFAAFRLTTRQITTIPDVLQVNDRFRLSDADFAALNDFPAQEFVANAVRIGGYAYESGNGEPLEAMAETRRVHQEGDDVYPGAAEWHARGWRHLLSMRGGDHWDAHPEQGSAEVDYSNPTFGGDGQMAVYVNPRQGNDWVDPLVLANAVAPVIR